MATSRTQPIVGLGDPSVLRSTESQLAQAAIIANGKSTVSNGEAIFVGTTLKVNANDVTLTTSANNQPADVVTVYSSQGTTYVSAIDQTVKQTVINQIGVNAISAGNGISISSSSAGGTGTVTISSTAGNIAVVNLDGNITNVLHGDGSWSADLTTYGNSNVVTLLSAFGSNTISTTGNISGGNLVTGGEVVASGNVSSGTGLSTGGFLSVNGTADLHDTTVTGYANVTGTANTVGGGATVGVRSILAIDSAFGSNSSADPASAQAVRGRVTGSNLTKTRNYVAGVTGQYLVTGTNASEFINTGLLGVVGDQTTTANAAVVAYLDGDGGLTTAGSAYGVSMKNSTPNSGFNYGLDLQFIDLNVAGTTTPFKQADIRFNNGVELVANTANNISINANVTVGNITANNLGNITTINLDGSNSNVLYGNGVFAPASGVGNVTWAQIEDKDGNSGPTIIALGQNAGFDGQGNAAIAIGKNAGAGGQGASSITIGEDAGGNITQGANSVAIGRSAGFDGQGIGAVAIGSGAGSNTQGNQSVAIGENAGVIQGSTAVAIGQNAGGGVALQGDDAVAIGHSAGSNAQSTQAVAIGLYAGQTTQGTNSIAIGANAGITSQGNNSIILNATGANLNQTTANTFTVSPVRNDNSNIAEVMFYNNTSKEVTYGNTISVAGNITGAYILGNGSGLTSLPIPTVTQDITSNGAMSIMTYDGNLKYVNYATVEPSTGNIAGGNLSTSGTLSVTGNITGGNITTAGVLKISGALSYIDVAGTGFIQNGGTGEFQLSTANATQPLKISTNSASKNWFFYANGDMTAPGNITAGNVSATTFTGALSGAATSATTAGTVTTNAQPNITSVGTLTSISVSGNANVGNLGTAGLIVATGNISGTQLISNIAIGTAPLVVTSTTRVANLSVDYANVADFITVAAGTGNNFLVFANAATGNVSEVTSTGITANLSTNAITATTFIGALANGNSNVNIATANGNVTIAAVGNTTMTVTGTGANVTGTLTSTGKIGYASGSTVTQATNRGTGVTINAIAGTIITTSAAMVATEIDTFSVTNSSVDPNNDIVLAQIVSPNQGTYNCIANPAVIGGFNPGFFLNIVNISGFTTSDETITIRFMVIKAPNA